MGNRVRARLQHSGEVARARPRSQRGELLIETLVTISLVGLGVVAIVAALGTVTNWSTSDRTTAKTEALLWSYGEALSVVPYEACTVGGDSPYLDVGAAALPAPLPDGTKPVTPGNADGTARTVVLTLSGVQYWNSQSSPAAFEATCPKTDPGAQALTLTATSGDSTITRTLTIYKRRS